MNFFGNYPEVAFSIEEEGGPLVPRHVHRVGQYVTYVEVNDLDPEDRWVHLTDSDSDVAVAIGPNGQWTLEGPQVYWE